MSLFFWLLYLYPFHEELGKTMQAGVVIEKGVVAGTAVDEHEEDRRQQKSHILFTSYMTIF
jgi:hypothetical protein